MKKITKNLKKTIALALATTMITSSVVLANPITAYEDTHRLLLEEFEQRRLELNDYEDAYRILLEEFSPRLFGSANHEDTPNSMFGAFSPRRFERRLAVNIVIPTDATTADTPIATGFNVTMIDATRLEEIDVIGYSIVGRTGMNRHHEIVIIVANAPAFSESLANTGYVSTEGWIAELPAGVYIDSTARVARGENNLVSITIPVTISTSAPATSISSPIIIPVDSIFASQEGMVSNLRDEYGNLNLPYSRRQITVTIDETASGTAIVYAVESDGAFETERMNFSARVTTASDVRLWSYRDTFRSITFNLLSNMQHGGELSLCCCSLSRWFRFTDSNGNPVNLENMTLVIPAPLTGIIKYMIDNNESAARAATRAAIIDIDEGRLPARDNFRRQLGYLVEALGGNASDPLNDMYDFDTHQSICCGFSNALATLIFNLNTYRIANGSEVLTMDFTLQGNSTATNWEMTIPSWTLRDNNSWLTSYIAAGSGEIRRVGVTTEVSSGLEADFNWNEPTSLSFNGQTITLTLNGPTFTDLSPALFSAISTGSNVASWFTLDDGRTLDSVFGGDNFTATVAQGSNSHVFEITLGGTFDLDALHNFFGLSPSTETF